MNLGELAYPDVPEGAVHLLPLGATEPHGPHAPLSTDTLISVGICERAAERLDGEIPVLVLPAMPYGVTRYGAAFPGVVSIWEETLRSLVAEIAESVGRLVLVNSHFEPEQVVSVMSWALRGIVERLVCGDYPWGPPGRPKNKTTKKTAKKAAKKA